MKIGARAPDLSNLIEQAIRPWERLGNVNGCHVDLLLNATIQRPDLL